MLHLDTHKMFLIAKIKNFWRLKTSVSELVILSRNICFISVWLKVLCSNPVKAFVPPLEGVTGAKKSKSPFSVISTHSDLSFL